MVHNNALRRIWTPKHTKVNKSEPQTKKEMKIIKPKQTIIIKNTKNNLHKQSIWMNENSNRWNIKQPSGYNYCSPHWKWIFNLQHSAIYLISGENVIDW